MNINQDKVPSTVNESIEMFIEALTSEEIGVINEMEEKQIVIYHNTWGESIRNDWSLWEVNTPLTNNFKSLGITNADDMSSIIMVSAYRKIHKKPVKLEDQVKKYKDYWNKKIGKPNP